MFEITFAILISFTLITSIILWNKLQKPSRSYKTANSVASEYDKWTNEKILEYYWGEHVHLGYYGNPPAKKEFIKAKEDFIEEMYKWGVSNQFPEIHQKLTNSQGQAKILDVGCGIGGSSRYLAKKFKDQVSITGITLSPEQVKRATELAQKENLKNTKFMICDALDMKFPTNTFDVVWALESEPHIPDKKKYVEEMFRVLAPGGILVLATWNVRDTKFVPLSPNEKEEVQYLYDEWCHPNFISIRKCEELFTEQGLINVTSSDWSIETIPSWRESIYEAFRRPRGLLNAKPHMWWRLIRDTYTILRMDKAFKKGLCQYGMVYGQKKKS